MMPTSREPLETLKPSRVKHAPRPHIIQTQPFPMHRATIFRPGTLSQLLAAPGSNSGKDSRGFSQRSVDAVCRDLDVDDDLVHELEHIHRLSCQVCIPRGVVERRERDEDFDVPGEPDEEREGEGWILGRGEGEKVLGGCFEGLETGV
jgi:hypothetical protein